MSDHHHDHDHHHHDGEPGEVPGVRVKTHPSLCLGWGECNRWAPEVYPLDEDGKIAVHLLEVPPEQAEAAWWGAAACPQQAITVIGPPAQYWVDRFQQAAEHADRTAT